MFSGLSSAAPRKHPHHLPADLVYHHAENKGRRSNGGAQCPRNIKSPRGAFWEVFPGLPEGAPTELSSRKSERTATALVVNVEMYICTNSEPLASCGSCATED